MRQSTIGRKPFRFTGSSFSSHLLNNFEARLRMRNSAQRTPTPIPSVTTGANGMRGILRSSAVALSAPPRPLLSVPDRFTMAYTHQIDKLVEKKKRLKKAELALLNRMNEMSTTENYRTWDNLRREGHSIVNKVVEGMNPVFVGKELRVRDNGTVDVDIDVYKQPTLGDSMEMSHPLDEESATAVSTSGSEHVQSRIDRGVKSTSKRLSLRDQYRATSYDSDDEFVAKTSHIGPLPPLEDGQLLQNVIDQVWVVVAKDVHEVEKRQKTRRVSKLAKSIECTSAKEVASVLASSLSKNELAKVAKALKKGGSAEVAKRPTKAARNSKGDEVEQPKSVTINTFTEKRAKKVDKGEKRGTQPYSAKTNKVPKKVGGSKTREPIKPKPQKAPKPEQA